MAQLPQGWIDWGEGTVGLLAAIAVALLAHRLVFTALDRAVARTPSELDGSLVDHARRPTSALLPLLAVVLVIGIPAIAGQLSALTAPSLREISDTRWAVSISGAS